MSRLEEVEALAARTIDAFGAVHVVCNNAGVESGATFADIPAETWDGVLGVDLLGTIYGIKTFLPLLREHAPDGHIVNTSSIAGLDSYFLTAAPYVAAKHAVVGISEELFHELAAGNERIGVSVLCPGMIATQMPWSERNRPDHVPASLDHPSRAQLIELTTMGAKNGMPPADVAELVVQAIRESVASTYSPIRRRRSRPPRGDCAGSPRTSRRRPRPSHDSHAPQDPRHAADAHRPRDRAASEAHRGAGRDRGAHVLLAGDARGVPACRLLPALHPAALRRLRVRRPPAMMRLMPRDGPRVPVDRVVHGPRVRATRCSSARGGPEQAQSEIFGDGDFRAASVAAPIGFAEPDGPTAGR